MSQAAELLLECHGRIRAFLATARRIAVAAGSPPGEVAEAAAAVHRYFTQALPLHAADEERSILPRLRSREPALDAALDAMVAEHAAHQGHLADLTAACAALAAAPARHAELASALLDSVAWLESHLEAHLGAEEAVVLPGMRRWLGPEGDAAVVSELRARRAEPTRSQERPWKPSRS